MTLVEPVKTIDALQERLTRVRSSINAAALRSGRSPETIKLIAISKTHPAAAVRDLLRLSVADFGENRVQEAEQKIQEVGRDNARWHLVGHLQPNKAKKAVKLFDCIHSIDSLDLAQRLDRLCAEEGRESLAVMIQVDWGLEATKSGASENNVLGLAEGIARLDHVQLIGLMTLPPYFDDAEQARPFFRKLRELRDSLMAQGVLVGGELSMGMTHDFEVAIEEGATMVRIGTAIFGAREPQA